MRPKPLFIAVADLHRTDKKPTCRVDKDFIGTQNDKLRYIAIYSAELEIPIICAGDTFDSCKCSWALQTSTCDILNGVPFFACYGQHELPYHSLKEKNNSPLAMILRKCSDRLPNDGNTHIHFISWGEEPPAVKRVKGSINILVQHKLVWKGKQPFPNAQGDVSVLIKEKPYCDYDMVITGDNHTHFTFRKEGTTWLNCGCVFRTDAKEVDNIPMLHIVMSDLSIQSVTIPHIRDLVSRVHLEDKVLRDIASTEFIDAIRDSMGSKSAGKGISSISSFRRKIDGACLKIHDRDVVRKVKEYTNGK